ncbi:MAG: PDDEXK nuclease domain-containing protein [Candidatus Delongbacteria bacterium]|jgi:predicted nuclease of restriction endonuclease-like (RecB) superfamily|nr:PDDEXK nuclease domain-containing protein [Candidatus Delongbacteria bacterium]
MVEIIKNNLYKQIVDIISETQKKVRASVNSAMVITYWNIGRIIVEDELKGEKRAEYGKETLKQLSKQLTLEFGKGYDERNLRKMRQFFIMFPIRYAVSTESSIVNVVSSQLSWTHYRHLIKVENEKARLWYMNEAIKENWSTRALERQINSHYFERILSSQKKESVIKEATKNTKKLEPQDILKDPYVLEFLNLKNRTEYTENEFESAILNNLQNFLLELGSGFSFVSRQKHIDLEGEHFYIDLVFYNYILKCFVLIDLKRGKLTHQDVGQMDSYIRIFEEKYKQQDDNPTIGLILCSEKNEAIAKYSVLAESKKMFASKYRLYLPTEEQLENMMIKEISVGYNLKNTR